MIENYLLEQFVAFAKYGTLLKAAEMLHISQPSLSRSMRKIEEEFGVSLFHRENSKIMLNETGKIAAEYAERALQANQEMIHRVVSYDRSLRTVSIGSCAPFPLNEMMPVLQERLPGKTISAEIESDEKLLFGLKNRIYQLVILHDDPEDSSLFSQQFMNENLYISIPEDNALTKNKSINFSDLKDMRILMDGNTGFWKELCLKKLPEKNLLIQNNFDSFSELVDASSLPFFNSDLFISRGYDAHGRVSIPIDDPDVHVTYRLACLDAEKTLYRAVFNAVRARIIQRR